MIGGDHSITLPILRALAAHHGADDFSVIHFDTHADTGEIYEDGPLPDHGQPFSRAVEEGVLLGGNIVQIGLRGCWPFPEDFDRMREQGFRWYTMGEIDERGLEAVLDDAIAHARKRAPRTYLTVDVDSMDPAFAPGHGHARAGRADLARAARRRAPHRLRGRALRRRPRRGLAALRRRRHHGAGRPARDPGGARRHRAAAQRQAGAARAALTTHGCRTGEPTLFRDERLAGSDGRRNSCRSARPSADAPAAAYQLDRAERRVRPTGVHARHDDDD